MLLQTNSYIVPREKRSEHARLLRKFRQTLLRLGCDHFEVYEQVGANWSGSEATGRFVQILRFRDRKHQQQVQAAERHDPVAQQMIGEFCALINFPYQQQQGLFAVGFYRSGLPVASRRKTSDVAQVTDESAAAAAAAGGAAGLPPHVPEAEAPASATAAADPFFEPHLSESSASEGASILDFGAPASVMAREPAAAPDAEAEAAGTLGPDLPVEPALTGPDARAERAETHDGVAATSFDEQGLIRRPSREGVAAAEVSPDDPPDSRDEDAATLAALNFEDPGRAEASPRDDAESQPRAR